MAAAPNYFRESKLSTSCATVDFGKRNFHDGHGEWGAIARNGGNRCAFLRAPTAIGYAKLGDYFAIMGNCDLDVLAVRSVVVVISGVGKVASSKQDSRRI